jgi:hypothetical protein
MRTGCVVKSLAFNAGFFGKKLADSTVTAKRSGAGKQ